MKRIRIAAHVHSDWSYDGTWSLRRIADVFGRLRYGAVLLAEHDRGFDAIRWKEYRAACRRASSSTTLLVPGLEYSDPTNSVHVPVWGDVPFLGEGLDTDVLLRRVGDVNGLAFLAHPGRREVLRRLDPQWLTLVTGVELWNRKYDGYAPNRGVAELLIGRPSILPLVSLDFHTARQLHPLTMVAELEDVTEKEICDAMQARRAVPTAFGVPASRLAEGACWSVMRDLEVTRKRLATGARRAEAKRQRLRVGRPSSASRR